MKFVLSLAAGALLLLTGACARTIIPEEVLQMPEDASVYTACNLWCNDKGELDSINIQKGTLIPVGTPVEFVKASSREIVFRNTVTGKEYRIHYDISRSMLSPEAYIKKIFTMVPLADQMIGVRPFVQEKILRGIVSKGMTRQEVLLAYGPPPAFRTPSETVDTWVYYKDRGVTKRIVFFQNRVLEIIELE